MKTTHNLATTALHFSLRISSEAVINYANRSEHCDDIYHRLNAEVCYPINDRLQARIRKTMCMELDGRVHEIVEGLI